VQQWIWEAWVVPKRPVKSAATSIVMAMSSTITFARPVAGDALGGDSEGPSRIAS